jgi:hypothetical protein
MDRDKVIPHFEPSGLQFCFHFSSNLRHANVVPRALTVNGPITEPNTTTRVLLLTPPRAPFVVLLARRTSYSSQFAPRWHRTFSSAPQSP